MTIRAPLYTRVERPRASMALRTWAIGGLLLTTLAPSAPTPFAQGEWPNPRGPLARIALLAGTGQSHVALRVAVPSTYWRAPLVTRVPRIAQAPPDLPPNTLVGAALENPKPFLFDSWVVPRGGAALQPEPLPACRALLELQGEVPFAQADWPTPRRRVSVPALPTSNATPLLVPPGPAPFAQGEWPNPRGPLAPTLRSEFELSRGLATAPVGTPFATIDWPVPRARGGHPAYADFADWLVELPLPFVPGWIDNPLPGPRAVSLLEAPLNFLAFLTTPPGPTPFAQADWPVPRGAREPDTFYQWTDELRRQLIGQDQFFGAAGQVPPQLDWPVPQGKQPSITLGTWHWNLLQSTLAPFVPSPFAHSDWPVPAAHGYPIVLRTWRDPTRPQLLDAFFGEPGQPPANVDWPVPRGAEPVTALITWANLLQGTVASILEPQRISFQVGREKIVYVSAREIRVYTVH